MDKNALDLKKIRKIEVINSTVTYIRILLILQLTSIIIITKE